MKKKVLALTICLAMIAIAVIGGTLAYFTDQTDPVENTLTVGKVDISLDEPAWDGSEGVEHILMPGVSFAKNPIIRVAEDSERAWLFLDVTIKDANLLFKLMYLEANENHADMEDFPEGLAEFKNKLFSDNVSDNEFRKAIVDRWIVGIDHEKWIPFDYPTDTTNIGDLTLRFGYINDRGPGANVTFMQKIQMPATVTTGMINELKTDDFTGEIELDFKAYAVQSTEVATLKAAHDVLWSPTTPTP